MLRVRLLITREIPSNATQVLKLRTFLQTIDIGLCKPINQHEILVLFIALSSHLMWLFLDSHLLYSALHVLGMVLILSSCTLRGWGGSHEAVYRL